MDNNIPVPGPGMNVKKIVLRVGATRLLLTIHTTLDSELLYIGSAETYCAYAQIVQPSSPFYAAMEHSDATLVKIQYNVNCTLEKNFQRGIDTSMIMALMIAIIKERFPFLTGVQFTDASYRTCDNNETVELPEMYYVATGKTWYETRFGAQLVSDDVPKFLDKTVRFQEKKLLIPWISMKREMRLPLSFPIPDEELQQMYDNAATWQEFFGPLRSRIGVEEFCIFVAPWLHGFIKKLLRFNFAGATYRIPFDSAKVPSVIYTTEPYAKGAWRTQTRKRAKRRPMNEM
jgi:hypothetical protein